MSFNFWQKVLVYSNVMFVCIGLLAAFAGNSFIFEWYNSGIKNLFFNGQEYAPDVLRLKDWESGIVGATIAGYHTLVIFVAAYPFKKKEKWAWNAIAVSMLVWFIIDSGLSLARGAYFNIYLINIFPFLFIGISLLMTRKHFKS